MGKQKKIAIYGKGGIGKSTTVANIAAAYSEIDKNVMVIGCDPKADTTRTLCGKRIPTIVNTLKDNKKPELEDLVFKGFNDIKCVESGGPEPGVGCAGRGVIVAMKRLENLNAFDEDFDVILYDVLGDVVYCVVSRNELVRLKSIIHAIDPHAFVSIMDVRDVAGEGFTLDDKKQPLN